MSDYNEIYCPLSLKGIAASITGALGVELFNQEISNVIEIDKPYFNDVLKRFEGFDTVYLEVVIKEDENVSGKKERRKSCRI